MDDRGTDGNNRGKLVAAISNAITGIHREHYGRGADRVQTMLNGDYVVCLLEDIYTPVERTLIDAGRFDVVEGTRHAFQETMRDNFVEAIEGLCHRKVVGFLSQVHVDPDLSIETFILEPKADTSD